VRRIATVALVAGALLFCLRGDARADAYLRVIAQAAPIHTGPGASYREIYRAERGEVFQVLERGTRGFWFRVELEDGTTGWIFGELVFPFDVVDDADPGFFTGIYRGIRGALLGPSPVTRSDIEISFSAGMLDREGMFLLRPGYLIDPRLSFEGFAGLSPRGTKDLFIGGLGLTLRMIPGAAIGPYVHAGVGAVYIRPKADNFIDDKQTLMAISTGGGFEITFKKQITLRLDFRNWTLFDPDEASNGQEYSGGLAIFF
jgi:hypothetical protein